MGYRQVKQKIYSVNEKGTNISIGIITEGILNLIKHSGIDKHVDIVEANEVYYSSLSMRRPHEESQLQTLCVRGDEKKCYLAYDWSNGEEVTLEKVENFIKEIK